VIDASKTISGIEKRSCVLLVGAEQHGDRRGEDQGAADETEHRYLPRHVAGPVEQVAEQQPDHIDAEAGPEQKRPVVDGYQRLAGNRKRARIRAGSR